VTILVAILGLGLLVLIHELGHFGVSLALRMRPRKFYVGFPPAIAKTKRGGVEYGIGAIPLGGFVKIPGMHRPAPSDVDAHFGRLLAEAPTLAGATERLRGTLAAGDMDGARAHLGSLREQVAERRLSEPVRAAAERGLTELDDALGPDAYWRAETWKRVVVIFAGPAANILLALVLFFLLFLTAGGRAMTTVEEVRAGSPAAAMGLRPGDDIVAIDSNAVGAGDISKMISSSEGRPLTVVVVRDGGLLTLGPQRAERSGDDRAYRLGFVLAAEGLGPLESASEAFRITGLVTKEIGATLGRLVSGSGRDEIASPVGIVQGSSEAAKQGTDSYLWVLALISLSIALLNLLPLLPLDGGHIAFAILEGVRGRSVGREVYEKVSVVGIALVLLLFFIGLSNDIGRLS
jgi:regulator of sigma E protease